MDVKEQKPNVGTTGEATQESLEVTSLGGNTIDRKVTHEVLPIQKVGIQDVEIIAHIKSAMLQ